MVSYPLSSIYSKQVSSSKLDNKKYPRKLTAGIFKILSIYKMLLIREYINNE